MKQYIKEVISEVYKLSPEDEKTRDEYGKQFELSPDDLRVLGLQSEDDIRKERKVLQLYQKKLQSSPTGKKIIRKCVNGEYLILHGLGYEGSSMMMMGKGNIDLGVASWIKKYGKKGNDTLSCVLFPSNPNSNIANWNKKGSNAEIIVDWVGLVIKGYPVFLSGGDSMTQTLGAITQGLKDHQKNSGIAKRPGPSGDALFDLSGKVVDEALIDNWEATGIYLNSEFMEPRNILTLSSEAFENNLPTYLYNGSKFIGKYYSVEDIEAALI